MHGEAVPNICPESIPTMTPEFDYLVIGAGPAGLQMAYFLHNAGHRYQVLEAGHSPGTFFQTYPRHRKLISINKVHTGFTDPEKNRRWDWNSLLTDDTSLPFKNYSRRYWPDAGDLVRYLGDFAEHHGLNIRYGFEAGQISRHAQGFTVRNPDGETLTCKRLIMATGVRKPFVPDVPGIELCEKYTEVNIDPETFANQRVLILGKGNSGFEMAELLTETTAMIHVCSPNPIKMAWATHHVGHLRAVNNNFLDTYQLKTQNAVLDAKVQRIERQGDKLVATMAYAHADGEEEQIAYDRILVCAGFRMDTDPFDQDVRPTLCIQDRFPAQTPAWESVNVPGLYFAGTLMQARDFKKTSSGFIHGFRYNIRALFQILQSRYHDQALPRRAIDRNADTLTDTAIQTFDRSSALWQQFGFLGDVVSIDAKGQAHYQDALPVEFIHKDLMAGGEHYFVLTLEYGSHKVMDPFQIHRPDSRNPDLADRSVFLHPVVRHFQGGQLLAEQHLMEHLETDWTQPYHVQPLREFFERELASLQAMQPEPLKVAA